MMGPFVRALVPYRFVVWASGKMLDSLDREVTRTANALRAAQNILERREAGRVPSRVARAQEAVDAAERRYTKAVEKRDRHFELRTALIAKRGRAA